MLPDGPARLEAAQIFDTNLVVVAGAGTGKTSLLVERALNLFFTREGTLDRSVLMTFTNKAAAELRQRIANALMQIIAATRETQPEEPPKFSEAARSLAWLRREFSDAALQDKAQSLMEGLEAATIGTIHGYAAELLRRHPLEAGLPPHFTPDEGEERKYLFQETWPRFMAQELGGRSERDDAWRRTLSQFSLVTVKKLAQLLIRRPSAMDHLVHRGYDAADARALFRDSAKEHLAALEAYDPKLIKEGNALTQWQAFRDMLNLFLESGLPGLHQFDIHAAKLKLFETTYSHRSVHKDIKEDLRATMTEARRRLRSLWKIDHRDLDALAEILRAFASAYHREASRLGMPAMDDLLIRAKDLLRKHPDIRKAEAARAWWLFIDEFQDNDPLQYEIAFLLAAAGEAEGEWPELEPGRLFIVGDPKQSIYRFRGADITAYQIALDHIQAGGGRVLYLSANFRSGPGIVRAVNSLFEGWIGANPDRTVDPEYVPLQAVRDDLPESVPVELISVQASPDLQGREAEAQVLAQAIRELTDSGVRQRDIAVLFRATTELPIYTRVLHDYGLSFVVEGGKSFFERPEVVEGLALLRALANPADSVAFVGVCRGTFGGVTDEELVRYAQTKRDFSWRPSDKLDAVLKDFPAMRRVVQRLRELAEAGRTMPVDRLIQTALLDSELSFLMAAFHDGAQRVANLGKLAERGASISLTRMLSLEATLDVLEDTLMGDNKEWESPLADENLDAVRILTIHKAKGLEYSHVFLPDFPAMRTSENTQGFFMGRIEGRPVLSLSADYASLDSLGTLVSEQERQHSEAEFKRLLYVAMTRAKNKLTLLTHRTSVRLTKWLQAMEDNWGYALQNRRFPDPGWLGEGAVNHRVVHADEKHFAPGTKPDHGAYLAAAREFDRVMNAAGASGMHVWRSPSQHDKGEAPEPHPGALPPELAALVGNTVHRALELWDFKDSAALSAAVEQSAPLFADAAWDAKRIAQEASAILQSFSESPLALRLAEAEILGREVPVLMEDAEGATVHGTADLLYRHDGEIMVADYKTDFQTGEEAAQKYASQLADYGRAVKLALGLDETPRQEVLFIRTAERITLGSPGPSGDQLTLEL